MTKWLKRLRRLLRSLDLLRPERRAGSGGAGGRSVPRSKPTAPSKWRVGTKDYVTVGGRSFVLQRGPGGTVRVYDASGRPVAVAANRSEADQVMAELAAEANQADAQNSGYEDVRSASADQSDSGAGGEA
ncbi:MAG: hypothetical protein WBM50_15390 [Acidimicrobiales bacterium]